MKPLKVPKKRETTLKKLYAMALELTKKYTYETNYKMWTLCLDWNREHPEEEIFILSEKDTKKNIRLKAHEALSLTNGLCSMIKSVIQEKIRWNSTLREDTEQREIYNNSDERL